MLQQECRHCLVVFLCLLFSLASAAPPVPRNVTLTSQNFQHILTWQPGDVSGTSFLYRVQYEKILNIDHPEHPEHCSNTSHLKCDLTGELTDVDGEYSVQVQSLSPIGNGSEWVGKQFNPREGTRLGPPIVHLTACDSCINVTIQPPVSYLKSADRTRTTSLLDVYNRLKYTVTLKGPGGIHNEISEEAKVENFTKIIDNLLPKSNYCISVHVTATSNQNQFGTPSALKCIVTGSSSSKTGAKATALTIVFGVLAAIAVMTLLIVLNATGVLCLRSPPFPKALCSIPKSESAFWENKWKFSDEKVCAVDIIFKEKGKKDYDGEETDESDTEAIREEYAFRPGVRTNSSNVADNSKSVDLQTLTASSLVDVGGQETLSTAPTDSEEHQSIVSDESGASKDMMPLMGVHCSSAPLDNSGSINVNLSSVMLGTLPKRQKDDVASEASSQGDQDSSLSLQDSSAPLLTFDFNLLIDKIGAAGPELPVGSDNCFSNEALLTDESESEDSEQNQASEYMRR